jgi:hypothetical protein
MTRRSSAATSSSSTSSSTVAPAGHAPQTTLAPGAWPFGATRPATPASPPEEAPAAKTTSGKRPRVTFGELKVEKGVPLPSRVTTSTNEGQALLERMAPGDMVRVTESQAKALGFAARRTGIKVTTRRLSATELGLWRLK